jgi:hypothetical protein
MLLAWLQGTWTIIAHGRPDAFIGESSEYALDDGITIRARAGNVDAETLRLAFRVWASTSIGSSFPIPIRQHTQLSRSETSRQINGDALETVGLIESVCWRLGACSEAPASLRYQHRPVAKLKISSFLRLLNRN